MNKILLDMAGADGGGGAGGELTAPAGGDSAKTVSVSSDLLPDAKPGDTYTVKSVADGKVTLECEPSADSGDDWGKGLAEAAPRNDEGMM